MRTLALVALLLVGCGADATGPGDVDGSIAPDASVDAPPSESWLDALGGRWQFDRKECYSGGCQPAWFDALAAIDVDVRSPIVVEWRDASGASIRRDGATVFGQNCVMLAASSYMGRGVSESAFCVTMPTDRVARASFLIDRGGGGQDEWDVYFNR